MPPVPGATLCASFVRGTSAIEPAQRCPRVFDRHRRQDEDVSRRQHYSGIEDD